MHTPAKSVRVEIYDQSYEIRGNLDPDYLRNVAQYVDGKMRSITEKGQVIDSLRVAVLAAINIADEYYQLKARHESHEDQVEQKTDEYISALDEMLTAAG